MSCPMKKTEIYNKIYHVELGSAKELALTFLRFQEYHESPKFKDRIFSLKKFKKWYSDKNGQFSYHSDYSGFNIPSWVLTLFFNGNFNPLSNREKKFLSIFKKHRNQKFYIIGTLKNESKETLKHELAHALFYTNSNYRKEVLAIIKTKNLAPIKNFLKKSDYHPSVYLDECHAYILDGGLKCFVPNHQYYKTQSH